MSVFTVMYTSFWIAINASDKSIGRIENSTEVLLGKSGRTFSAGSRTFSAERWNFFSRAVEKVPQGSRCFCPNCDLYDFYCRRIPNLHFKSVLTDKRHLFGIHPSHLLLLKF
jgi:hypothetical protein